MVLKDHKTRERASAVTKQECPSLVKELWEKSFKENQIKGGFCEAGLYPFNPTSIPGHKTAPSLPFKDRTDDLQPINAAFETPLRKEL
jgi:hypothetical protein